MKRKPIIGLVMDHDNRDGFRGRTKGEGLYNLVDAYVGAIETAGGLPLGLFFPKRKADIKNILANLDGVVLTGGYFDIDPHLYGQRAAHRIDTLKPLRTFFEIDLFKAALAVDMPTLGICGGMQLMNVALGGTLFQDVTAQVAGAKSHEQKKPKNSPQHAVDVASGSRLAKAAGRLRLEVNSTHHQAVDKVGRGLEVCGLSPDGVIEAFEMPNKRWILGAQWHPELLWDRDPAQKRIFSSFIKACR